MNKKTLYIHVGNFKTGTTAIQDYMFNNVINEIHYPRGMNKSNCHGNLVYSIIRADEGEIESDGNEIISQYIKDINNAKCNVLLSAEAFMRMKVKDSTNLSNFISKLEVDDIKVILFTREPKSFVASWYNQMVKELPFQKREMGNVIDYFVRSIDSSFVSNLEVFTLFESVVGKGCFIIESYSLFGIEHLNKFCDLIMVKDNPQFEQISNSRINNSKVEIERISKSTGEELFKTRVSMLNVARKIKTINEQIDCFNECSNNSLSHFSIDDLLNIYLKNAEGIKEGFVYQDRSFFQRNIDFIESFNKDSARKVREFFSI